MNAHSKELLGSIFSLLGVILKVNNPVPAQVKLLEYYTYKINRVNILPPKRMLTRHMERQSTKVAYHLNGMFTETGSEKDFYSAYKWQRNLIIRAVKI